MAYFDLNAQKSTAALQLKLEAVVIADAKLRFFLFLLNFFFYPLPQRPLWSACAAWSRN